MSLKLVQPTEPELPDPDARPGSREHCVASMVFGTLGVILVLLFLITHGWQHAWILLTLGIVGCIRAGWHFIRSRMLKDDTATTPAAAPNLKLKR